jgi:hypothetical protein
MLQVMAERAEVSQFFVMYKELVCHTCSQRETLEERGVGRDESERGVSRLFSESDWRPDGHSQRETILQSFTMHRRIDSPDAQQGNPRPAAERRYLLTTTWFILIDPDLAP